MNNAWCSPLDIQRLPVVSAACEAPATAKKERRRVAKGSTFRRVTVDRVLRPLLLIDVDGR